MKLSKREVENYLKELLPMLREIQYKIRTIETKEKGHELLARGIEKQVNGEPIIRSHEYVTHQDLMGLVNHSNRIKKIINAAKTQDQLENDLALYLAKNAKSLDAIKNGE